MATTYGKDYRDFDMDMGAHPSHGDLEVVTKTTAINRSIKNILKTQDGERLFQPNISGGIGALLFENFSNLTTTRLEAQVERAIEKFEPRADVIKVEAKPSPDENAYYISITYVPNNDIKETELEVYMERTR
tara:strand:+ start:146 stop:541 length:396 start_codon:yes stop_codon:yes gene_type:complete